MKKTGLLLLLCLTVAAAAQQADSAAADQAAPQNTEITTGTFPVERGVAIRRLVTPRCWWNVEVFESPDFKHSD